MYISEYQKGMCRDFLMLFYDSIVSYLVRIQHSIEEEYLARFLNLVFQLLSTAVLSAVFDFCVILLIRVLRILQY